jgi:hypothetical protein
VGSSSAGGVPEFVVKVTARTRSRWLRIVEFEGMVKEWHINRIPWGHPAAIARPSLKVPKVKNAPGGNRTLDTVF